MAIDVGYPKILDLFTEYLDPKRSQSASFLIWYLENYYRLDQLEAVDSVCDQSGDKGVDGIFVNDADQTITVLQSKISQDATSTIGDKSLREFQGTLTQLANRASVEHLAKSAGSAQVASLIRRLDLASKVDEYEVRGEFVSNVEIDTNGLSFLASANNITFVGRDALISTYCSDERNPPIHTPMSFDIQGIRVSEYIVDGNTKAIIAPVKAKELVKLEGVADQSLFTYNVRGPLGKTQVNKDIVRSINDPKVHRKFPLFHNGITIIADKLESTPQSITVSDYFVVNGCQSLSAFYDNHAKITDDLMILVKFIEMDPQSSVAKSITEMSNNQNGVKARDFKSNNPIQIRLQNEFSKHYKDEFQFEIKRGEGNDHGTVISNEIAGLYLMAFDLKEPWSTHRKYQVFEDKYASLFGRKEVTADHIVLCDTIMKSIEEHISKIKNTLFGKHAITRYFILYTVRLILEADDLAVQMFSKPATFVRNKKDRDRFKRAIGNIVADIVEDVNASVEEDGDDFDYRNRLRDEKWVTDQSRQIVVDHKKLVRRAKIKSFKEEWDAKGQVA
jgi:AIPR protein